MTAPLTPEDMRLIADNAVDDAIERAEGTTYRTGSMVVSDLRILAAEVKRLRAQVAAVEKVRDKYKQNMKRLAGLMTLSYCDPFEVNRTAVRDLNAALASGDEVQS